MSIAELATLGGTGFAIALALAGAAYAFGRLTQRVAQVEKDIGAMRGEIQDVRGEIGQIRTELRDAIEAQTDRILAALANHRHDTDGNTVFTIPRP